MSKWEEDDFLTGQTLQALIMVVQHKPIVVVIKGESSIRNLLEASVRVTLTKHYYRILLTIATPFVQILN